MKTFNYYFILFFLLVFLSIYGCVSSLREEEKMVIRNIGPARRLSILEINNQMQQNHTKIKYSMTYYNESFFIEIIAKKD